jgi:excisionase family DNA binding protein
MPGEWLTTGQAAELLGISRSTVVRYIEAGTLDARRLPGGRWRVRRVAAEKLLRDGFDTESPNDDRAASGRS